MLGERGGVVRGPSPCAPHPLYRFNNLFTGRALCQDDRHIPLQQAGSRGYPAVDTVKSLGDMTHHGFGIRQHTGLCKIRQAFQA
ncbi:hypothetical protein, partial [Candidatus Hamiltonella defensa]|uniref:hypothetical protein n=1 Tax=Candidatus Williamhamiltonella defendens TaxID=138072 RepID=UPI0020C7075B